MADSKKYDGSQWEHSLRKLTTATEAVENPLYSDGTAITAYTIKGNEEHTGSPSPQNPVMPNGVGVRTENIIDTVPITAGSMASMNYENANNSQSIRCYGTSEAYTQRASTRGYTLPAGTYTLSFVSTKNDTRFFVQLRSSDGITTYASTLINPTFTLNETTEVYPRVCGNFSSANPYTTDEVISIMLNIGSTAKPYEPYGYKIPISSGGVTTNIYLGSTQTVRQIKKLTFTGNEDWQVSSAWKKTNTSVFFYNQTDMENTVNNSKIYVLSDKFEATSRDGLYNGDTDMIAKTGSYAMTIRVSDSIATTAQAFKTWLASNPVTAWYVLATPTTATVNEPLMKIGTYTDTLSNAVSIPTTEGANSITVDTTVQPSEFTATWTGWHDASVKEKSENLFDGAVRNAIINDSTGEEQSNASWRCSNFIEVSAEKVTLSWTSDSQFYQAKLGYYEADETFISTETIQGYFYSGTFTIPNNCKRIKISYSVVVSGSPVTREDIMLNTGSTALPYEPYWK